MKINTLRTQGGGGTPLIVKNTLFRRGVKTFTDCLGGRCRVP